MSHSKDIHIFVLFVIIMSLVLPGSLAEIVTLKNGETIEGDVIGSDDSTIRVKSSKKIHTLKRTEIKSLKGPEPREELLAPAENIYASMASLIDQADPEAHYKLGLFCLERGLPDYANSEFTEAKELNKSYEKKIQKLLQSTYEAEAEGKYNAGMYYYNNGEYGKASAIFEKAISSYPKSPKAGAFQKMLETSKKEAALLPPPLTDETASNMLKNWDLPVPYTVEDQKKITAFIMSIVGDEEKDTQRRTYCAKYLETGKNYFEMSKVENNPKRWRDLYVALNCYNIGACGNGESLIFTIRDIASRLGKNFEEKLSTPKNLTELKAMKAFAEELSPATMESLNSTSWYYKAATDYESKSKTEENQDNKRDYLKTASYCYLILTAPSLGRGETEKAGLYGWARCFERLAKSEGYPSIIK